MRRAFSLIELMISVILLSIIVTFLYQAVAQLQNSNVKLIKSTDKTLVRENLLKMMYNDFFNATSVKKLKEIDKTDLILMQSSNSFYGMSMPYVHYQVNDGVLRRIESTTQNLDFENHFFYFDTLAQEVKMFKVYMKEGHVFVYFKAEDMDEIFLDLVLPALGSKRQETNSTQSQENKEGEGNIDAL